MWQLPVVSLLLLIGYGLGCLRAPRPRHQDPSLHHNPVGQDGTWQPQNLLSTPLECMRWNFNGVPWYQASVPMRDHEHWAQTCEIANNLSHRDRCACGAERWGVYGEWTERE